VRRRKEVAALFGERKRRSVGGLTRGMILTGKRFLVTGASSGIGRQVAIGIAERGGMVCISARNPDRLQETLRQLKGKGHGSVPADLGQEQDLERLAAEVGAVDGIVHAAGITKTMPVKYTKRTDLEELFAVNVFAPILLTSRMLKGRTIRQGASIVFFSSMGTTRPYFGGAAYLSSKSALEGYCRAIATEVAAQGIRANCLCPGYVRTGMTDRMTIYMTDESLAVQKSRQVLGEGSVEDVASVVVFLLSDESRWMTGTSIVLGG
jgi:NAD(P)-dependent dehydrogenase (short-subunit alcohol dehydrogenase family)